LPLQRDWLIDVLFELGDPLLALRERPSGQRRFQAVTGPSFVAVDTALQSAVYSITSSARASRVGGTVMPTNLAA
jgi:hypothetical protein